MTADFTDEQVTASVAESTARCGVPFHLTDPDALRRIASLSGLETERKAS